MNRLITSYSRIHTYFVEDPEPVSRKYREFTKGLDKGENINDFLLSEIEAPD